MRFQFQNSRLKALYTEGRGARKYPPGVIDAFFEAMAAIRAAQDERDIRALKGLRYERLKGKRKGQHSLRPNEQYRIVIERETDEQGTYLVIISIEDYH